MWVSTGGRAGLKVTEEMEHSGEVVCKHREILSQRENETTRNMKAKRGGGREMHRGGIRGWVNMSQEQTEQQEHIKIHG